VSGRPWAILRGDVQKKRLQPFSARVYPTVPPVFKQSGFVCF
jgi:hypothetical protein